VWAGESGKADFVEGSTLLYVLRSDKPAVTRCLIEAGANVEAANSRGETPLMLASEYGNVGVVQELLKFGASVLAQNKAGHTVIDHALFRDKPEVLKLLTTHEEHQRTYTQRLNGPHEEAQMLQLAQTNTELDDETLNCLTGMGYARDVALNALEMCYYDINKVGSPFKLRINTN
jgi:ankyrin repeat protein